MIKLSSECLLVPPKGCLRWMINISSWFMVKMRQEQRRTNLTTGGGNCPKTSRNVSSMGAWNSAFPDILLGRALGVNLPKPLPAGNTVRGSHIPYSWWFLLCEGFFFRGTPWPPSVPALVFPRGRGGSYLIGEPLNRDGVSFVLGYKESPTGLVSKEEPAIF